MLRHLKRRKKTDEVGKKQRRYDRVSKTRAPKIQRRVIFCSVCTKAVTSASKCLTLKHSSNWLSRLWRWGRRLISALLPLSPIRLMVQYKFELVLCNLKLWIFVGYSHWSFRSPKNGVPDSPILSMQVLCWEKPVELRIVLGTELFSVKHFVVSFTLFCCCKNLNPLKYIPLCSRDQDKDTDTTVLSVQSCSQDRVSLASTDRLEVDGNS